MTTTEKLLLLGGAAAAVAAILYWQRSAPPSVSAHGTFGQTDMFTVPSIDPASVPLGTRAGMWVVTQDRQPGSRPRWDFQSGGLIG